MTAIRDFAGFNAVHDAGLAKLLPPRPRIAVGMGTCGSGNGAEAVMHAFAEAIDQRGLDIDLVRTGCFGFCAEEPLVNVRLPGQPLVILHRVQVNHVERILDERGGQDRSRRPGAVPDRGMGPSHLARPLWRRLQRYPPVERGAFLPRPEEDRPAQRRVDQSRRHRGIHRRRRLPGALQGADRRQTRGGQRADQGIRPARARRRRLLDRSEMGIPAQGRGRAQVPHLQRRRGRSRRLHEPQRDRERSARADRGHGDRRLHHRRHGRHHLRPRRISARRPPAEGRASARPANTASWARTSWAAASPSTSTWSKAPAPSSAAKRRR